MCPSPQLLSPLSSPSCRESPFPPMQHSLFIHQIPFSIDHPRVLVRVFVLKTKSTLNIQQWVMSEPQPCNRGWQAYWSTQVCDESGGKKVIDVDQESLIDDLVVCDEKCDLYALHPCLVVQCQEGFLEFRHSICGRYCNLEHLHQPAHSANSVVLDVLSKFASLAFLQCVMLPSARRKGSPRSRR